MHIGVAGWAREGTTDNHRSFLTLVSRIDRLGFDSFWLTEHHFEREVLPACRPTIPQPAGLNRPAGKEPRCSAICSGGC